MSTAAAPAPWSSPTDAAQPPDVEVSLRHTPHVHFHRVAKSYDGDSFVVQDLELVIDRGEFLTLLGPSGSGKSTCLMMLAGFETPTVGDILLEGERINTVPAHRRNIGMVFQNYALFPHMTVLDNVRFPLTVRPLKEAQIRERAQAALAMVQLESLAQRYPRQLSGGQQQRVALARALVFDPRLVLMDEPLGALDRTLRERLQLEIRQLQQRLRITVVFVTHDQSEAMILSDRIAVFHQGRIQQVDTPRRLYEEPINPFVATFLGENNLLAGEVRGTDPAGCVVALDDGTLVRAQLAPGVQAGDRTLLMVRPERLQIEPTRGDNRLAARVRDSIYLGDQVRIRLVRADGSELLVRTPTGQAAAHWREGLPVQVGFDAQHARALPAQGAAV